MRNGRSLRNRGERREKRRRGRKRKRDRETAQKVAINPSALLVKPRASSKTVKRLVTRLHVYSPYIDIIVCIYKYIQSYVYICIWFEGIEAPFSILKAPSKLAISYSIAKVFAPRKLAKSFFLSFKPQLLYIRVGASFLTQMSYTLHNVLAVYVRLTFSLSFFFSHPRAYFRYKSEASAVISPSSTFY